MLNLKNRLFAYCLKGRFGLIIKQNAMCYSYAYLKISQK